uniref:F-BAR domain only protein 2 n=1 Tax=Oncorhynchus tshawytscha TaxID=74940 RepID=A0AAZ3Q819_ONCTS
MITPYFLQNFWGEKNNGFDVLYHNMKHGQISSKELTEFIRERATIEEVYARSMTKLAKSAGNFSQLGTFAPVWDVIKTSTEKLASCHLELVRKLQELIKDVQKYVDDQAKAHKKTKEEVASTLESVQTIQTTGVALQKSKENYNAKTVEQERLRKEGATQRDVDKAGVKAKKATETYKGFVEKYATAKSEFEQKMAETAQKFQDIEESHIIHMKDIIQSYTQSVDETHVQIGEVRIEFERNMENTSVEGLIQKLSDSKGTGKERPGPIEFEECNTAIATEGKTHTHTLVPLFSIVYSLLNGKKQTNRKHSPLIWLGVIIRSASLIRDPHAKENSFYSSSDSEDEDEPRKFRVEIKPVAPNNRTQQSRATIDQLKASIGNISLSPPTSVLQLRTTSFDRNLLLHNSVRLPEIPNTHWRVDRHTLESRQTLSNASPPPAAPLARAESSSSLSSTASLRHNQAPSPPLSTVYSSLLLFTVFFSPFPSSPFTPSPLPQFIFLYYFLSSLSSLSYSLSSPPSSFIYPVTLASQDALPIAVAFTESVNAYFKGADPAKCIVKITGDMTLSFPMGIIKVFTSNPSPAMLTFKLKNTSKLEQILPNQTLLFSDPSQSDAHTKDFWFNMQALTSYLRKASEQNPAASYYNVDILKYQVSSKGIASTPLNLAVYWKCDPATTDLRLDYHYNPESMLCPGPLSNVQVLVHVDGGVTNMQSLPNAIWNSELNKSLWKLNDISEKSDNEGSGSLRAKFELSDGPSTPTTLAVQFMSEGSTLSGVDIELLGTGYRLSLNKKRFATGRYMADC